MRFTRRSILAGGISLPLASIAGRAPSFAAEGLPNPLMVTVSGVDPSDLARLEQLLEPLLARKVPLTVTLCPFDPDGRRLTRESGMARWLRQCLRRNPDLLELGIHLETVDSADPYFQLRQASEAQAVFSKALNERVRYRSTAIHMAKTVTTGSPLISWQDCSAMRVAGIRSVIHLAGNQPNRHTFQPADGGYWTTDTGLVNIFGSQRSSLRASGSVAPLPELSAGVRALARAAEPIIVDVPLSALGGMSGGDIESYGVELAQGLLDITAEQSVRLILPRTLYAQSRQKDRQFVIVRVDDLRLSPASDRVHTAFTRKLADSGYPFTEAIVPAPMHGLLSGDTQTQAYIEAMRNGHRYDIAAHGWHHTPQELLGRPAVDNLRLVRDGVAEIHRTTRRVPVSYVPPNNAYDENTLNAVAQTGTPIISTEMGDLRWFSGMDRHGLIHLSNTIMFEREWSGSSPYFETREVLDRIGEENDTVFCIHPLTAHTPEKQQRIFDTLASLSAQQGTTLVNFDEYYRAVVPPMANLDRIRDARADVMVRGREVEASAIGEDALKEDAALAWRYFEWGAENFNGMAPATSWVGNGRQEGYPFTTMWDVGTYILAAISAHRIGLIDDDRFETTILRILAFLGEANFIYRGAKLPPTERALRTAGDERKGFDSADTGRLLIALKVLEDYASGTFAIAPLVASWGFETILNGGEMHIVKDGRASSAHRNSYANYVGRGYRLWGHEIKAVFNTGRPDTDMDEAIETLAEVAQRGRIATEPHVTEEIELGGSPHGRLMADLLYSAQLRRYQETGILTCVSEGPVTGEPFFAYQGYQIEPNGGGHFVVDAPVLSARHHTARRENALRAVSSKGAYLWHAARPGGYSDKLLEFVREKARMPGIGFSSGIAERTQRPFAVSDLNTNGIILEAIAYVLDGRKPFFSKEAFSGEGL